MENNINKYLSDLIFIQKIEIIANKLDLKSIHPDCVILDRNQIIEIGGKNDRIE